MDGQKLKPVSNWLNADAVPVLPDAASHLLSTLYADDVSIKSVTAQVEQFPTIAARLLAVANSAWSAPSRSITELADACTRLGLDLVRSLSIALAMSSTFEPSTCPGFDGVRHWVTALLAAEGATLLARGTQHEDDALTWRNAALFHNIGLLWFADRYPQATGAALVLDGGEDLAARMQRILGVDYCDAGAWVAQVWELPEVFVSVIGHQRDPRAAGDHSVAAATVGIGVDMASCIYRGEPWTPDRVPAGFDVHDDAELLPSTYQRLCTMRQRTHAMGSVIAGG